LKDAFKILTPPGVTIAAVSPAVRIWLLLLVPLFSYTYLL